MKDIINTMQHAYHQTIK